MSGGLLFCIVDSLCWIYVVFLIFNFVCCLDLTLLLEDDGLLLHGVDWLSRYFWVCVGL